MTPFLSPSRATASASVTVNALARPADLRNLPLVAVELVVASRMAALFEQAAIDPLPERVRRYGNIEAAIAVDTLLRTVAQVWPDRFAVARPCCTRLTPDEATLGAMAVAARYADRSSFAEQLIGFVRADRHEALYQATLHAVALLPFAG